MSTNDWNSMPTMDSVIESIDSNSSYSSEIESTWSTLSDNTTNDNITPGIYTYPSLTDYYKNPTPFVTVSIFVSICIVMLNIFIYLRTILKMKKRLRKPFLNLSIALVSFYPIISIVALITLLIPQIWLICHTIMHLSFTIGAILFYYLCLHYIDSEDNFIKETAGMAVTIRTQPCCCCCICLPGITPTRKRFSILRYMVWQMLFIQGSIMLVLNGIYFNDVEFYNDVQLYFLPFIIASVLVGEYGLKITIGMVNSLHADYRTARKMFSLQLIMIFCKAQYLIMYQQMDVFELGGAYPMNHVIYKQTIINTLILVEMIFVSLLAQSAYKTPIQIDAEEM